MVSEGGEIATWLPGTLNKFAEILHFDLFSLIHDGLLQILKTML